MISDEIYQPHNTGTAPVTVNITSHWHSLSIQFQIKMRHGKFMKVFYVLLILDLRITTRMLHVEGM